MSDSSKWEILTIAQSFRFANYIANPSNICIIMNILVPSFLLLVRILWSMFDYNIYIRNICIHYTYIKMNCKVGYVFTILMCNVLLIHAEKNDIQNRIVLKLFIEYMLLHKYFIQFLLLFGNEKKKFLFLLINSIS